ncbi:MAG: AraC family transcriptional regulator [Sphaerochaetaceae bacterium]|nr:AraC family transcriptional regulator [Sphaerochaetaceae bacterium]
MNTLNKLEETIYADYDIQHKITNYNEKFCCHTHKDFEIFFTNCEGVVGTIGQKNYTLKKNTAVLLNTSDSHWFGCTRKSDFDRYVTLFKLEFLNHVSTQNTNLLDCFYYRPFPDPQILELTEEEATKLIQLQEAIIKVINRKNPESFGKDLEIVINYAELLLLVNRIYRKHHHIYSTTTIGKEHKLVYQIINYINRNFFEEITLDNLAEEYSIDKFTLCRIFSKVTSVSPIKYLINCRLNKAKELLQTDMTIEKICFECGFNNLSNFSKSFKAHYLISPKSYQMNARKEKLKA